MSKKPIVARSCSPKPGKTHFDSEILNFVCAKIEGSQSKADTSTEERQRHQPPASRRRTKDSKTFELSLIHRHISLILLNLNSHAANYPANYFMINRSSKWWFWKLASQLCSTSRIYWRGQGVLRTPTAPNHCASE